jgi:hypothetical protein
MKVISFSLWGSNPKYVAGAIKNAELAPAIYPGWRCRFYCDASVPASCIDRLGALPQVDICRQPEIGDWMALFWRFRPAADRDVDVVIFRDADSRLNRREAAAVDEWLRGSRDVHVMRDHPEHGVPILGGMWGVRRGALAAFVDQIETRPRKDRWQVDQEFLAEVVAPCVRDRWLEHDEYFGGRPFPTRRRWREFVGQPFDEHDRPLISGPTALERQLRQTARRVYRAFGTSRTARASS